MAPLQQPVPRSSALGTERRLDIAAMVHRPVAVAAPPRPAVTIVIPTYRERENITPLLDRLAAVRESLDAEIEVLIVDDPSGDGTDDAVASYRARHAADWARLISRNGPRGLSAAVLDGFAHAEGDVLVVMDADLSHPPEALPRMLEELERGADVVVGSRYVPGGSTDDAWGVLRWINSAVATLLSRPLTSVRDPMSGYFALRREALASAPGLNPVGYKILLEVIVKCSLRRVAEVPIRFGLRHAGESKLSLREQARYLLHLWRLYRFAITRRPRTRR